MAIIKFNYLKNENKPVSKKGGWYDIPMPYDLYFKAGEIVKIVFDLRLKMPYGYEAIIQPRSSTLEKTGLISSGFGVIEDTYCGPDDYVGYRFYATKDGFVSAGSCLVQMRFQEKMKDYKILRATEDEFVNNKNRGGFGSTDNYKSLTEPKTEYQQGFSTGFDEGYIDGYEEGFRDGNDMAVEGISKNFDANSIIKAQKAKTGDYCPFNLWNYAGLARCICLPKSNNSCGVIINENCPFRKKGKNA